MLINIPARLWARGLWDETGQGPVACVRDLYLGMMILLWKMEVCKKVVMLMLWCFVGDLHFCMAKLGWYYENIYIWNQQKLLGNLGELPRAIYTLLQCIHPSKFSSVDLVYGGCICAWFSYYNQVGCNMFWWYYFRKIKMTSGYTKPNSY